MTISYECVYVHTCRPIAQRNCRAHLPVVLPGRPACLAVPSFSVVKLLLTVAGGPPAPSLLFSSLLSSSSSPLLSRECEIEIRCQKSNSARCGRSTVEDEEKRTPAGRPTERQRKRGRTERQKTCSDFLETAGYTQ